jgi:hypothetical protein
MKCRWGDLIVPAMDNGNKVKAWPDPDESIAKRSFSLAWLLVIRRQVF